MAADKLGKVKTVMQMLGIIAAFTLWATINTITPLMDILVSIWFWIVALITTISGVNYVLKGTKKGV